MDVGLLRMTNKIRKRSGSFLQQKTFKAFKKVSRFKVKQVSGYRQCYLNFSCSFCCEAAITSNKRKMNSLQALCLIALWALNVYLYVNNERLFSSQYKKHLHLHLIFPHQIWCNSKSFSETDLEQTKRFAGKVFCSMWLVLWFTKDLFFSLSLPRVEPQALSESVVCLGNGKGVFLANSRQILFHPWRGTVSVVAN